MNIELLKSILILSTSSSIISTSCIQKIKKKINNKIFLYIISIIIPFIIGISFSLTFSDLNIIDSIWVGLITFLESDSIYKSFEDKILSSFSKIKK